MTDATDALPTTPSIDAHQHVWDLAVRDQPWTADLPSLRRSFAFDEVVPSLRRHHVDGVVLVQTLNLPEETLEMLALAATQPLVRGVVGWVDLTRDDVADELARLRGLPGGETLVGIRHQVQYESVAWLRREDVHRGLRVLAEHGLVYELVVTAEQLATVADVVAALPGVSFVLDHAGKPDIASGVLEPWRSHVRAIAAASHVRAKLSGLATEAGPEWRTETLRPYADVLLDEFGPDRLMFGSDWPVCLPAGSYDEIHATADDLTSGLSRDERSAVFGGTATRVYGLTR